jgi:uncharacterized cupin superfamily protein
VIPEATLTETEAGLVPVCEGWFVVNLRDASWWRSDDRGHSTELDGEPELPEVGCRVHALLPGRPTGMYHGESGQEGFLVLSGECILVVEGEERRLKAWDFVHCPPWTEHIFVGAGDRPCVVVMFGARRHGFDVLYPVNDVAAKHGASVDTETRDPEEAYARSPRWQKTPYVSGLLPGDPA